MWKPMGTVIPNDRLPLIIVPHFQLDGKPGDPATIDLMNMASPCYSDRS